MGPGAPIDPRVAALPRGSLRDRAGKLGSLLPFRGAGLAVARSGRLAWFDPAKQAAGGRLCPGHADTPVEGAGAAAATDPSAPLTQLQIQDVLTPESSNASGFANMLIVQPVLPFPVAMPGLKEIFPVHIIRPTLPIISPSADPNGPFGTERGLGDLALIDVFIHPVEGFGSILLGYTTTLPTASDPQLGLREFVPNLFL